MQPSARGARRPGRRPGRRASPARRPNPRRAHPRCSRVVSICRPITESAATTSSSNRSSGSAPSATFDHGLSMSAGAPWTAVQASVSSSSSSSSESEGHGASSSRHGFASSAGAGLEIGSTEATPADLVFFENLLDLEAPVDCLDWTRAQLPGRRDASVFSRKWGGASLVVVTYRSSSRISSFRCRDRMHSLYRGRTSRAHR